MMQLTYHAPGNIKQSSQRYKGFEGFEDPSMVCWGLRALRDSWKSAIREAINTLNYWNKIQGSRRIIKRSQKPSSP